MPAVDEMWMVAARQFGLTYYGQQRCAACRGVGRVKGARLREDGSSAECRAVMCSNWLTTMKDSSGQGAKSRRKLKGVPLSDR